MYKGFCDRACVWSRTNIVCSKVYFNFIDKAETATGVEETNRIAIQCLY